MSQPFVGEIRMFAGNFAPTNWMLCQGQLLPISEYETLFNLIGTTYGGDGQNNFALPNLQSRVPIHVGPGFALGQAAGSESVTLNVQQIPSHTHTPACATGGGVATPNGTVLGAATSSQTGLQVYSDQPPDTPLGPGTVGSTGGSQPHDNMIPFLVINFNISLFGVFPSQS